MEATNIKRPSIASLVQKEVEHRMARKFVSSKPFKIGKAEPVGNWSFGIVAVRHT
jgi:hypothetical protein